MYSQNPNYTIKKDCIQIIIYKPIGKGFVFIRELYVDLAIDRKIPLRIVTPQGTYNCDAIDWKKTGKRAEKVFLRPNEPMILWGNYVIKTKTEEKKGNQDSLF